MMLPVKALATSPGRWTRQLCGMGEGGMAVAGPCPRNRLLPLTRGRIERFKSPSGSSGRESIFWTQERGAQGVQSMREPAEAGLARDTGPLTQADVIVEGPVSQVRCNATKISFTTHSMTRLSQQAFSTLVLGKDRLAGPQQQLELVRRGHLPRFTRAGGLSSCSS